MVPRADHTRVRAGSTPACGWGTIGVGLQAHAGVKVKRGRRAGPRVHLSSVRCICDAAPTAGERGKPVSAGPPGLGFSKQLLCSGGQGGRCRQSLRGISPGRRIGDGFPAESTWSFAGARSDGLRDRMKRGFRNAAQMQTVQTFPAVTGVYVILPSAFAVWGLRWRGYITPHTPSIRIQRLSAFVFSRWPVVQAFIWSALVIRWLGIEASGDHDEDRSCPCCSRLGACWLSRCPTVHCGQTSNRPSGTGGLGRRRQLCPAPMCQVPAWRRRGKGGCAVYRPVRR